MKVTKKSKEKVVLAITRIDIHIPCPWCGCSLTVSNIPVNIGVSCVECGKKFSFTSKTEIMLPPVLRDLFALKGKWLPKLPTKKMVTAFFKAFPSDDLKQCRMIDVYKALLSNAPKKL